jgi:hypothetical protein
VRPPETCAPPLLKERTVPSKNRRSHLEKTKFASRDELKQQGSSNGWESKEVTGSRVGEILAKVQLGDKNDGQVRCYILLL